MTTTRGEGARQVQHAVAPERLMICVAGMGESEEWIRQALERIVRVKLHMNSEHQIGIAMAADRQSRVLHEFTRDMEALSRVLAAVFETHNKCSLEALHDIVDDAVTFCGKQLCQPTSLHVDRVLLVCRVDAQEGISTRISDDTAMQRRQCYIDVVAWTPDHAVGALSEVLHALTRGSPDSLVFDSGDSRERLHQALSVTLAHPAQRMDQAHIERLLQTPHVRTV